MRSCVVVETPRSMPSDIVCQIESRLGPLWSDALVASPAHRSQLRARRPEVLPQHPQHRRKSNVGEARRVADMSQPELCSRRCIRSARIDASHRRCGVADSPGPPRTLLGAPVARTGHRSPRFRRPADVLPQRPQRFRKSNTVKARGVAVMPQRELFPRLRMRSARMPASDRACGDTAFSRAASFRCSRNKTVRATLTVRD